MQTYNEFKDLQSSEKIVLAEIYANELATGFNLYSGSIYYKEVDFLISSVYLGGTVQTLASSLGAMSSGKYFYENKKVYVWGNGEVKLTYKLCFSNIPKTLPYDLDSGFDVEWEARILSTSQFGHDLDSDQMGIALQGQGSIGLINNDGFFDQYYECLNFDSISIYSYNENLPLSEKRKIFEGFISGKQFSAEDVQLQLVDFVYKLNLDINLPRISESDGILPSSFINQPKRRVYGRVDGLKCVPVDCTLDGFSGSGKIVGVLGQAIISGVGTDFLNELSPNDTIYVGSSSHKVKTVNSISQIEVTSNLDENITESDYKIKPSVAYRRKNRKWLIAHHKLKKISCTITSVLALNRFKVNTIKEFNNGDNVYINGSLVKIKRVSGNQILLDQNLGIAPAINDVIYKYPVQSLKDSFRDFLTIRDYELAYDGDNALIEFDELAEFNVAKEFPFTGTASITGNLVTGVNTSFDTDFSSRDWVNVGLNNDWYEVLAINSPTEMVLRSSAPSPVSGSGNKKNVSILHDESSILVNCYGKTEDGLESGNWIKTGADVIKDILSEAGITNLDLPSFSSSQTVSLKLPVNLGTASTPTVKEVIDVVNKSILGSIFLDNDFNIEFSSIDSRKPSDMAIILDDDIIDWSVDTDNKNLVSEFIANYRHSDYDPTTGLASSLYKSKVNSYTRDYINTQQTKTEDIFLYDTTEAQEIAQRYALLNELPRSKVSLETSINLQDKQIGDRILLSLDRMFFRSGSNSRFKVFVINSIKKDGYKTSLILDDLGGIFNRVVNISSDTSSPFSSASEYEKAFNGYLTDNNGLITGYEYTKRINIVG